MKTWLKETGKMSAGKVIDYFFTVAGFGGRLGSQFFYGLLRSQLQIEFLSFSEKLTTCCLMFFARIGAEIRADFKKNLPKRAVMKADGGLMQSTIDASHKAVDKLRSDARAVMAAGAGRGG